MASASRKVQFTVGFASVPYPARQEVIRLWEDATEHGAQNWIVLDSLAADLIIAPSGSRFSGQNYQIIARLANEGDDPHTRPANDDGPLVLPLPITRAGLFSLFEQASLRLNARRQNRARPTLRVSRGKDLDALMQSAAVRTPLATPPSPPQGLAGTRPRPAPTALRNATMHKAAIHKTTPHTAAPHEASPRSSGPFHAATPGWESLALTLLASQRGAREARLVIDFGQGAEALVDFAAERFACTVTPTALRSTAQPPRFALLEPDMVFPAAFENVGTVRPLETLLWIVGTRAFAGQLAPWLTPSHAYRVARWPDFTHVPHTIEELRLTALLASDHYTPAALFRAARVQPAHAANTLNAFSLMDRLAVRKAAPRPAMAPSPAASARTTAATPIAPTPPPRAPGRFARLWSRLGF
ncbi:hypothetical protein MTR62_04990 [Novosphingobium sp. 1949]|uniref:Uncharacterized protein n=1 Tax=Novosphingobium organovorum TaxID=2930092 RepID=A0ABT0BAG7_9SPHN|nr:hypothetical protein [Novosphingobium organovorum]MCJ2182060.1 hypothetical protein [Novosphingobium organovorum]